MRDFSSSQIGLSLWPPPADGWAVDFAWWPFLFGQDFPDEWHQQGHILGCASPSQAEDLAEQIATTPAWHERCFLLPALPSGPYQKIYPSEYELFTQFATLAKLTQIGPPWVVVTSAPAILEKFPPPSFFQENILKLNLEDKIPPQDLAQKLLNLGYQAAPCADTPGTFCAKGEIFDVFPIGDRSWRILYFDEYIEHFHPIDPTSQKTITNIHPAHLTITPSPHIFACAAFSQQLRSALPVPPPSQKDKFQERQQILQNLSRGQLFERYPVFAPLFWPVKQQVHLTAYQKDYPWMIHLAPDIQTAAQNFRSAMDEQYKLAPEEQLLPPPEQFFWPQLIPDEFVKSEPLALSSRPQNRLLSYTLPGTNREVMSFAQFKNKFLAPGENTKVLPALLKFLPTLLATRGHICFAQLSLAAKNEVNFLLEQMIAPDDLGPLKNKISYHDLTLDHGFYIPQENFLAVSFTDLFSPKVITKTKTAAAVAHDVFAEQLASLQINDFVIHAQFGIGRYLGLQHLQTEHHRGDFLVIAYANRDKVYVPVYKMDLVQKHASGDANIAVANLRQNKFAQAKKRAKAAAQALAFDLLKLQAQRLSTPAYAFNPPNHDDEQFALDFPFKLTSDQEQAIAQVYSSLAKPTAMDLLVCGDVGFGKTEVAMRAAFKVVQEHKQVAVLVPTTILAFQHFENFKQRFKNFAVQIDFLSRFKTAAQKASTLEDLAQGKIDIIIGTHSLLGKNVKFADLGLVVVDEEHRFGVAHKEQLKLLKAHTHFLTLTATPIPRTLQLAFLKVKDLAVIQTPPPRRQSIKTFLLEEDPATLKSALQQELKRGGQIFWVHNRVQDIDATANWIQGMCPTAKLLVAHGQMRENELENRMRLFYQGKADILVCTTIIESGIDIPNANTMIVDQADHFGLAQLHQLRGRIGRGDRQAYIYLVTSGGMHTSGAQQRLQALLAYADMGAGMALASCDLEIRGSGDILGAAQSGHLEAIGLELYLELLQEAMQELKGEKTILAQEIEVITPWPAYFPESYIADTTLRLKYYKRLASCRELAALTNLEEELQDAYGPLPTPAQTLLTILQAKITLRPLGVQEIRVQPPQIILKFAPNLVDARPSLRNHMADFFLGHKKHYKFQGAYEVAYTAHENDLTEACVLKWATDLAQALIPPNEDMAH